LIVLHDVGKQPVSEEQHQVSIGDCLAIVNLLLKLAHLAGEQPVLFGVLGKKLVAVLAHHILFKAEVSPGVVH
jgi:hypothetical protein